MENILIILEDLCDKQEKTKSDLQQMKESLIDKIEGNFDMTLSQLRRNRESELKLIETTFAETETELQESMDSTSKILDQLTRNTGGSKDDTNGNHIDCAINNKIKVDQSKAITNETDEMQGSSEVTETRTVNEQNKSTVDKLANINLKWNSSDISKHEASEDNSQEENVHDKSEASIDSSLTMAGLMINVKKFKTVKYSVKLQRSFNIRSPDDTDVCDINGVCWLENGGLVLADTKNACLKVLDENFNMVAATEKCNSIWEPFSVCHLCDNRFVFSDKGRLKYMSIDKFTGNMKLIKTLSTGIKNWTVALRDNCIYIMCEQRQRALRYHAITKYSENGGAMCGGLGIQGQYMCFNSTGTRLYVTRGISYKKSNNVTIVDCKRWFEERCTFWHPELKEPCGVTVDDNDQVFVCGFASKNVLHFDEDGNKVGVLLEGKDTLDGPKCLGYDKIHHRLVVAGSSDEIRVLDLEQL